MIQAECGGGLVWNVIGGEVRRRRAYILKEGPTEFANRHIYQLIL